MRTVAGLTLLLAASACLADEQAIQRALIQRDQQSAEFAAQVRGSQDLSRLQQLHASQLRDAGRPSHPDPEIARQFLPYQRERMAQERELAFSPPIVQSRPPDPALPLPGGPRHGVDPIPPQRLPN